MVVPFLEKIPLRNDPERIGNSDQEIGVFERQIAHLPKSNITSTYIFAYNRDFFVYPNNTNQFVRYYNNTFQHGGISMEEMIVPFLVLKPR